MREEREREARKERNEVDRPRKPVLLFRSCSRRARARSALRFYRGTNNVIVAARITLLSAFPSRRVTDGRLHSLAAV